VAGRDRSAKGWLNPRSIAERVAINAVAIWVAAAVVKGIIIGDWQALVLTALVFGLINSFLKPIVKRLTCPLYFLTLGLAAFVVNAAMLGLTAWLAGQLTIDFRVDGIAAAIMGAAVVGVVAWAVSLVL
jgi:putative membrane protein